jgi:hypothetical protein
MFDKRINTTAYWNYGVDTIVLRVLSLNSNLYLGYQERESGTVD